MIVCHSTSDQSVDILLVRSRPDDILNNPEVSAALPPVPPQREEVSGDGTTQ